ncbi:phage portal protein [Streptomyces sp. NPDC002564]|uniref:phage portal protein n=1 Tax=Streptomyces sp. NPDC002564 TaxID=3364649 RepID=UPI0036758165
MSFLLGRREQRGRPTPFVEQPIPPNSMQGGGFARVDLSRTEASLQKLSVWACVNLVATIAETMPLQYFPRPRESAPLPSWLADPGGDGHGLPDWTSQYVYSSMLRGNVYGIAAERDRLRGTPTQIALQHPDLVQPYLEGGVVQWRANGTEVPEGDMWHRRYHPVPGRVLGLSPIELQALTIGTGISSLRFGASWFQDGGHPSAILSSEQSLDPKQAATAKNRFMAAVFGRREPVVLGNGWKYQAIQIAPNESQFLETNGYTSAECCRIFGPGFAEIFGYETGGSLTYSNIEQRSLDLLTYAVDPWLVRVERALTGLLPPGEQVRFNRGALVRTDLLTRYKAHAIALRNQFKVIDEVRDLEDMGPVPWGATPSTDAPANHDPAGSS